LQPPASTNFRAMGAGQSATEEAAPAAPPAEVPAAAPVAPVAAEKAGAGAPAAEKETKAEGAASTEKETTAEGPKKTEEKKEGAQIWIGNLVEQTATEEEVRRHFGGFGQIKDVKFKVNKKRGEKSFYAFATFSTLEQAKQAVEVMNGKVLAEGTEPIAVSFADRQVADIGKGKGKGKDAKGGGKAAKGKGKVKGQPSYSNQGQYPYYPYYSAEQLQSAWALHAQYYQQIQAQALQAQAYYSGFTGQVIPSQAAISAASNAATSTKEKEAAATNKPPPPEPPNKEFIGHVKSISAKNGYGFIICDETKSLYDRDVFVEQKTLPEDVEVKSKVAFSVELSEKGHPRATVVRKLADD